jgi:2-hydroxychromene-2-carboxylate isomerase
MQTEKGRQVMQNRETAERAAWGPDSDGFPSATRVEVFVDAACPWSWLTSRWLTQVALRRKLDIRWRPYSLLLRNGRDGLEDWQVLVWGASLRAARVMQVLEGPDPPAVGRFYEALVAQTVAAMNDGRQPMSDLASALCAAGIPTRYAAAADDESFDEPVRRTMAEAEAVIGEGVGTPAVVVREDPPFGVLGPVMSAPVTGDDAVRLWDAMIGFAAVPGALEFSRPRPGPPSIPGLRAFPIAS